jgi:hypothetical protein
MRANSKSRFVKIKKERGYGDDIWHVRGYRSGSEEFTLVNIKTKEQITIYMAHCYVDRECVLARTGANRS